jgi:DNA-binding transcriptional LysR family regulator
MEKHSLVDGITGHQLRAFSTVASTLSYAKAADILGYTQPGVHFQVKTLERLLGCQLFERSGRGLRLTEGGGAFRPALDSMLAALERVEQVRRETTGARRVTIASGPVSGPYLLPIIIREFVKEEPTITVDVELVTRGGVVECVARGAADIAIGARFDQVYVPGHLRLTYLFDEPYYLVHASGMSPSTVRPTPIYLVSRASEALRDALDSRRVRGIGDYEICSVPSVEAVKAACLTGRGYGFLAGPAVAAELQAGVFQRVEGFAAITRFWSCQPAEGRLRGEVRTFLEFLHRYTMRLQQTHRRPWLEYDDATESRQAVSVEASRTRM